MSQVDTLIDSTIDSLEQTATKLAGSTQGTAARTVQLLCEFDSNLAQLRAQCRELSMMNQLLRERLAKSLARTQELKGLGMPIAELCDDSHNEMKLDPRH